jgi:hypothetical protein
MEKTQQINYAYLSKLALDILSIPTISASPERFFSSAKLVLSYLRNKLGTDLLEAFECLKSRYKLKKKIERQELVGTRAIKGWRGVPGGRNTKG